MRISRSKAHQNSSSIDSDEGSFAAVEDFVRLNPNSANQQAPIRLPEQP